MQNVSLLIVTSRVEDAPELREVLRDTPWKLAQIPDLDGTDAVLKTAEVPILFFDRDIAGAGWRETIKRLVHSRRDACIVLLSNVADQYLWDEVVQQGGFDLLTRPFRKEQVLSTLVFAYAQFRNPWPRHQMESRR